MTGLGKPRHSLVPRSSRAWASLRGFGMRGGGISQTEQSACYRANSATTYDTRRDERAAM